ncbi:MAG: hypothetical protein ACOX9E_16495, partial [Lentisphaeria bacterium]
GNARWAPFAKFLLQTTKLHAESVPHTSLGLRLRRNPGEAPTRNSTLKACHIADTKDDFHCKATENSQLSMADRLRKASNRSSIDIRSHSKLHQARPLPIVQQVFSLRRQQNVSKWTSWRRRRLTMLNPSL